MLKERLQRGLLADKTGVSPVIGVILMVAVTVILSGIIGTSTLGVADRVSETPPQVQLEIEQTTMELSDGSQEDFSDDNEAPDKAFRVAIIRHGGGDTIDDPGSLSVTSADGNVYAHPMDPDGHQYYSASNNYYYSVIPAFYGYEVRDESFKPGDEVIIPLITTRFEEKGHTVGEDNIHFDFNSVKIYDGETYWDSTPDEPQDGQEISVIWDTGDTSHVLLNEEL